jgi:hypothetical protein
MKTLNAKSKYLVLVNVDEVSITEVEEKLKQAGINATVVSVPSNREMVDFYEIKTPFWKRLF